MRPLSLSPSLLSLGCFAAGARRAFRRWVSKTTTDAPAGHGAASRRRPASRTRAHSHHGGDAAGSGRAPTACASRRPPPVSTVPHANTHPRTPPPPTARARASHPSLCRGVWCRVHPSPRSARAARSQPRGASREEPPSAAPPRGAAGGWGLRVPVGVLERPVEAHLAGLLVERVDVVLLVLDERLQKKRTKPSTRTRTKGMRYGTHLIYRLSGV